jgi:large subunit ribosomal protein L17
MRHGVAGRKLGRNASQRSALWRGLITDLFRHDRISTTEAKARSMRGEAEHLITVAKHGLAEGGNSVHAHRLAARVITDPEVTKRLFDEIAPRFTERPGGYTRMVKVGPRLGDGADMVVLELVERGSAAKDAKDTKAKDKDTKAKAKAKDTKAKGSKEAQAKDKKAEDSKSKK